jgi:hypothetical protein
MGRIVPYSDIENEKVPNINDFVRAKDVTFDFLSEFGSEIYGAKVFGSVGYGTPNDRRFQ